MNKNPFVPQPSYTPQQPPLPPGPPPPQPTQPDYSAYWAAAAVQQPHVQPVGAYATQWTAPQAPRPPPEQSALYANYGYGGSHNSHWQQQRHGVQQPQQHYHQPPPPVAQPPPPQAAYNPYQPSAGYPQPYVHQAPPPPQIAVQPYPHPPPPAPMQQSFFPQHLPQQPHQHQQQSPRHNHNLHHTPPHHLPPAKRQRFDGPSHGQQPQHRPPQPQFQPPPPPPLPGPYIPTTPHGHGRGGGQSGNHAPIGGGSGRGGQNRGNLSGGGRGGRAGSMNGSRGGMGRGGRGGYVGGGGGGGRGGSGNALRGHGSRNNFGNNKEYHNRRGGSFSGGGGGSYSHQSLGGPSFRGRGSNHASGRGGRHDGQAGFSRDAGSLANFISSGKKDENRRTLTDFKIVGLEIRDLDWTWGILPSPPAKTEVKRETPDAPDLSVLTVKNEATEEVIPPATGKTENGDESTKKLAEKGDGHEIKPASDPAFPDIGAKPSTVPTPPPSRIRIYFHTPVTADDSHPIPHSSPFSHDAVASDSRKGKRKKLEDDDTDPEEGRAPPPPPQMGSSMSDGRSSAAASVEPSVADTAVSEGDWLMAAIVEAEGEGDADADAESDDRLHTTEIENTQPVDEVDAVEGPVNPEINGCHHEGADVDGHHDQITGAAHSESHGHEGDPELPAKLDSVQDVPGGDGTEVVTNGPEPGELTTGIEGSGGVAAEVNGTHAPVDGSVVDEPKDNGSSSAPDGASAAVPPPPEISQTDGHADAAPTQNGSSVPPESVEEPAADYVGYTDSQVPGFQAMGKPLEASASFASTVPDVDQQEAASVCDDDDDTMTINGDTQVDKDSPTQDRIAGLDAEEETTEPPTSSASNNTISPTLFSDSTNSSPKTIGKDSRTPSANRLSISYAGGNRRLVIDAESVEVLKVFRREGRIEVDVHLAKVDDDGLKGILIEGLSDATKAYSPLPTLSSVFESDLTLPPFTKVTIPSTLHVVVYLDTERPLSEPKWAKSGDIQDWLRSILGRMFWVAGDAADGWEKKIVVVDPDPPPTIWTVLDGWSTNSPAGMASERRRFVKTHMCDPDNILEILLRLVRGDRATPFSQSSPGLNATNLTGPLLSALTQDSAHGSQQTHVSLAVLAMFRMTTDYAKKAVGEKGKEEAEEKVGEIVRCLPSHLIYKSLDGMFKEWRVERKGR